MHEVATSWQLKLFVILACLVAAAQGQQPDSGSTWNLQADVQCAASEESPTALARLAVHSEIHCTIEAGQKFPTGALVAQFDRLARTCTVFTYQSICRDLVAGKSPSCAVFFRFPVSYGSISAKLNNVWLAGDVSRLENLVCQPDEDTNRLHPVGVQWSSEGAVFDGTAAHAVLNKSSIRFSTGLTWLLRIKRQPRVQTFFELTDCSTMGGPAGPGIHMVEYNFPRRLYARANAVTGTMVPQLFSPSNTLSADPNHWLNLGFTVSGGTFDMFVGSSFLPRANLAQNPDTASCNVIGKDICMYLGMRSNEMFQGTVRVLAFANVSMTEAEIREFFSLFD